MNRRSIFQAITGAIVASAMELGFVDKPRMICGFDPGFGDEAARLYMYNTATYDTEILIHPDLVEIWPHQDSRIREQKPLANPPEM